MPSSKLFFFSFSSSLTPHLRPHPARDRHHPGNEAEHVPPVEDAVAEIAFDEGVGPSVAFGRGRHFFPSSCFFENKSLMESLLWRKRERVRDGAVPSLEASERESKQARPAERSRESSSPLSLSPTQRRREAREIAFCLTCFFSKERVQH